MISAYQIDAAIEMLDRMITALLNTTKSAGAGRTGSDLRHAAGKLVANAADLIHDETIGTDLLDVFEKARLAGASIETMNYVRQIVEAETPTDEFCETIKLAGIVFTLVEQSKIITSLTFKSRSDVQIMMSRMLPIIDDIKLEVSDLLDGMNYQYVIALSASIVQHLSATERMLPRIVNYEMSDNLPTLTLANRFYADASRSDELIGENKTVHPAFVSRHVMALSA